MPMNFVAQPATANVPNVSGVPNTSAPKVDAVASVDLASLFQNSLVERADSQWGIFYNGAPVFTSARVKAVEMQAPYSISDAPIENGAFFSYNKVKSPRDIVLEILCDGSSIFSSFGSLSAITNLISTVLGGKTQDQLIRQEFLSLLENMVADLNVYQVVTPEATYQNMNMVNYRIRRSVERGITLIYADITMQEVRLITASQISPTQQPQGQPVQNSGNVQSQPLGPPQASQYQAGVQ